MSRLPFDTANALKHVRLTALAALRPNGLPRPIPQPLTVSNRGLARRFELLSDAALLENIQQSDADVAHLVFLALHEVLFGADARLRELTNTLAGEHVTAASATAAALLAADHFGPQVAPSVPRPTHPDRLAPFFDAAENEV